MKPTAPVTVTSPLAPGSAIGRHFIDTSGVAALACALILAFSASPMAPSGQFALVAAMALFGTLALASLRLGATAVAQPALLIAVALGALALIGAHALLQQEGLRAAPVGFIGLIVCIVGTVVGTRGAAALGAVAWAEVAALAWAESAGFIGGAAVPRVGGPSVLAAFAFHAVIVGCSVVGALLIGRALRRFVHAAADREQRFASLIGIAADWYWEQDSGFRFTHIARVRPGAGREAAAAPGRQVSIDLDELGLGEDALDAFRADLEAHLPFRDLIAYRPDAHGRLRSFSVAGEPRFDANGAFRGYWGVARDVTAEWQARHAARAAESGYHELFTRTPSPLLLHRGGIVFEANDAAARLFGFADAAAVRGFDLAHLHPPGPERERAVQRLAQIEAMAPGEALPVMDLDVESIDGRLLCIQATAVRVDTATGPANLSICYDITARQRIEAALRRSEAMLSHLFANSPDCIALVEMASGRHAMVNPAFCRLTGRSAAEVVGRTGAELGIWQQPARLQALLGSVQQHGSVADFAAVLVAQSGALISMLLEAGRFQMDGRDYLVLNGRDVTATERTRLQHTAILERASIGIAFTRDLHFVEANPYFERMFGWPANGLEGQSGAVLWASAREHAEVTALAKPLLFAGLPFHAERRMRRRDGSDFWCRLLAQAVDRNDPAHGGTIWIAEDVTERRRLDDALAAARDDALAASRAKSAFLANTSHEISTPINGLLGLTRMAMEPTLPAARRDAVLAQVLERAQHLSALMSDILDVSKIEAGQVALDDAPYTLAEVLAAAHRAGLPAAEAKGLALRLEVDPALPATVRGDAARLGQILSNFVANAVKFTAQGEVAISAKRLPDGRLRLAVADTGPGIDAAVQERLFTPFSQGDTSATRRFGGAGLGLVICRLLAGLMGGTVGVQSRPGQGSTFWAELPLHAAAVPKPTLSGSAADDVDTLRGAWVLMVEDNEVNMTIAVAMLEHWGVRAAQATDGRAAIEAVHAAVRAGRPFNAVLMDVQMPVMGGHEAARELRRHYSAEALPIIALTAASLATERELAIESGMNDFLTKPIDATVLRRTLARRVTALPRD